MIVFMHSLANTYMYISKFEFNNMLVMSVLVYKTSSNLLNCTAWKQMG